MNQEKVLIEGLIHQLKIDKPIPLNVQKHILKAKKRSLKKILKKSNQYNAFAGLFITIFLFLKKFGINLSIFKFTIDKF